jgi:hypothetical protein
MCLYVHPPIVARQRLGKHVPAVTTTRNEELLDASFSIRSVSYRRRVCASVCVSPYRCQATAGQICSRGNKDLLEALFSMRVFSYQ